MTLFQWLNAVVDGMMGAAGGRGGRRNSVWSRCSSAAKEVQGLEAKCLLSATPLAEPSIEQPALTNVDMNSLVLMSEAGFIQFNAIGLQDLSSLSPSQRSQFIYGPQWPATTLPTPSEDLYDEGAGAVWGSLSDEGGPSFNIPGSTLDGTGAVDMGADGILGTDTGGAVYSPPGPGSSYMGIDDVGEEYTGTGVNGDIGLDDVADYGQADTGDIGVDDVADYGPGDIGPGDIGPGDYGPGDYGPGDTADTGYDAMGALDSGFDDMGDIFGIGVDGPGIDDGDGAAVDAGVDGMNDPVDVSIEVIQGSAAELSPSESNLEPAIFRVNRSGPLNIPIMVLVDFNVDPDPLKNAVILPGALGTGVATSSFDGYIPDVGGWFDQHLQKTLAQVLIPMGRAGVDVKVLISNDLDYEEIERIKAKIVPHAAYTVTGVAEVQATIVDRTADLDVAKMSGIMNDEDREDFPGAAIRMNDNDSNEDGSPDLLPTPIPGLPFNDPDLTRLTMEDKFDTWTDTNGDYFTLAFDQTKLRLWHNQDKSNAIGYDSPSIVSDTMFGSGSGANGSSATQFPLDAAAVLREVWTEGIAGGTSTISLIWHHQSMSQVFDQVETTVYGLDLDIDSNNNGLYPERSPWEEELEDNKYGLGKLLKTDNSAFTPVIVDLDSNSWFPGRTFLRLDFNPYGQSGTIKMWTKPWSSTLRNWSVLDGGDRIFPGDLLPGAALLQIALSVRAAYVEDTVAFDRHDQKKKVEAFGKPVDRITATLVVNGEDIAQDAVRYMVVDPDTFYTNLQDREELRAAMAAEGVYSINGGTLDLPNFALRLVSPSELEKVGLSRRLASELGQSSSIPGFEAVVYRDYVSGKYVLSFAGTDDAMDALEDVWQGFGMADGQYFLAMELAVGLAALPGIRDNFLITGHSLGGGLASAAAVATGDHAITFNAAGLAEGTILDEYGEEWFDRSLARYHNANSLIDAYYLDWDILSYVQDAMLGLIPSALGRRIKMDGPNDWEVNLPNISLVKTLFENGAEWSELAGVLGPYYQMGIRHTTRYYQYGLMVREDMFGNVVWDIYGDDFY